MYGIGNLPADRHDFTVGRRRQTRQPNIRLHTRTLADHDWIWLRGLPVTLPSRIASDLLYDQEDPEAVANVIADAIRRVFDYPSSFAEALRPHAFRFRAPTRRRAGPPSMVSRAGRGSPNSGVAT